MKKLFFLSLGLLLIACSLVETTTKKRKYYWQEGDNLQKIAEFFGDNLLEIRRRNHIYEPEDLFVGFPLIIIPKEQALPKKISPKTTTASKLQFTVPSQGTITSKYGYRNNKFHYGVDFGANKGKQIVAAAAGVVKRTGLRSGYGNTVEIAHSRNITTLYAHLEKSLVKKRHRIKQKELIGIMGNTGRSSGVHLHFEIIVNGTHINPLKVIQ